MTSATGQTRYPRYTFPKYPTKDLSPHSGDVRLSAFIAKISETVQYRTYCFLERLMQAARFSHSASMLFLMSTARQARHLIIRSASRSQYKETVVSCASRSAQLNEHGTTPNNDAPAIPARRAHSPAARCRLRKDQGWRREGDRCAVGCGDQARVLVVSGRPCHLGYSAVMDG
jgi:hypothetical protein